MRQSNHSIKILLLIVGFNFYNHHLIAQKLPALIPFNENGLFGYCDSNLNVVIDAKYDKVYPFSENRALVIIDKQFGFIDTKGNQITPCIYKYASSFYKGNAMVKTSIVEMEDIEIETIDGSHTNSKNSSNGTKYINTNGEFVSAPFQWEQLKRNSYDTRLNYLQFSEGSKKGVMDKDGNVIVPAIYERTEHINQDSIFVLKIKNIYTIIDSKGKKLLTNERHIGEIKENSFFYRGQDYSEGYMSIHGDTISSSEYKYPNYSESYSTTDDYDKKFRHFYEGRAIVKGKNHQGHINLNGHLTTDTIYDATFNFKEGRAKVKLNNKYGFIDKQGQTIGVLKYDQVCYFYDSMAQVVVDGKCGYINLKGEEVIPLIYDYWQSERYSSFKNGFVRVRINENFGIIDRSGTPITEVKYDDIYPFINKRAIVKLNDKYGVIDENGIEIIPLVHDYLSRLDDFAFKIRSGPNNRLYGVINSNGKLIVPLGSFSINIEDGYEHRAGLYLINENNRLSYIVDKYGTRYVK